MGRCLYIKSCMQAGMTNMKLLLRSYKCKKKGSFHHVQSVGICVLLFRVVYSRKLLTSLKQPAHSGVSSKKMFYYGNNMQKGHSLLCSWALNYGIIIVHERTPHGFHARYISCARVVIMRLTPDSREDGSRLPYWLELHSVYHRAHLSAVYHNISSDERCLGCSAASARPKLSVV